MSGPQPGFLASYNSLRDKHLVGYFSNTRIRQHLQRSGLISRSGRIISEKEYRLNAMRKEHQRYLEECLARALCHKVLDMERHHQLEGKRKLENSVRKKRVQKSKVEHSRRSVEGASLMRAPHPPLGPRNHHELHPLVAGEPAGCSQLRAIGHVAGYNGGHPSQQHRSMEPAFSKVTSLRPNTVPGNLQHPLRLQPLHSCAAVGSIPKTSSSKQKCQALEHVQQFATGGERSGLRLINSMEYVTRRSPYQLPVIRSEMIPVPPPPLQKGDKRSRMPTGRQFRPTTAPNEQLLAKNSGGFPKPSLRSNVFVTMVFLGKSVHLSHDDADYRDEIKVYQQHCGGENLCVYKGKLLEGETFQFISKRHHGFPFSLTFFLNGIQVDRLSCCCEYKHQKRSRPGGRHRYFRFLSVEGASPCYRCIIAMSLDKKPSPPKRKMEEDHEGKHVGFWGDGECSGLSKSSVEQKPSKGSVLVTLPRHEVSVEDIEDKMDTRQKYRKELSGCESEDSEEDTGKNEYDEDFEADEDVNEVGQTGDQMNQKSKPSSDDKKHNLDYEKESETSSQKALQASDSERDESDGYPDSDSEDERQGVTVNKRSGASNIFSSQAGKPRGVLQPSFTTNRRSADSPSSISTQYSSEDDSHAKVMKDNVKGKEEFDIKKASDNAAHAQYQHEKGENKLLKMEENQEDFTLEKEGIGEAEKAKPEDLTAREDTGIFHENTVGTQHQSPEVNGELGQAGSVKSTTGENEEKNASTRRDDGEGGPLVPLESSMMDVEDGNEESPQSDEGGAPDGAFLADARQPLEMQKAAEQVVQEGQMVRERQGLEKEDFVAEGDVCTKDSGAEMAQADLLPKEDRVAVLQVEGQPAVEEPDPEENTMAEEDPKGKGTGKRMESGKGVAPGEQEVLMEGMESEAVLGEHVPGGEELTGPQLGREVDGAMCKGKEATEEAVAATGSPVKEVVGGMVSQAELAMEEGGFARKSLVAGAVSEGEEAGKDANVTEEGITGVVGPEGEELVKGALSEGGEAVEEPGALLETLEDKNLCTGEAMPEGEDFAKPNDYSQLKVSGEEWMEMGKAATEAATSETGKALEVKGSSPLRAEDTVEESVESGKGPMLQVAPGLEALMDTGGDPKKERSWQLEENTRAEEEEGSAEVLLGRNPSIGSKPKTESAVEEKPDGGGGVLGVSAGTARAGSGGGEEVTGGAADPRELEAGMVGSLERGKERPPGEGLVDGAWLPAKRLCVSEAGVVAMAVLGGQAGLRALAEAAAGQPEVAGDGGVGNGVVAQEKVMGAGQSRMGVPVAEGESAEGEAECEWGTAHLVSPQCGESCGAMSLGEELMETSLSTPTRGDGGVELRGRGSGGGKGLCLDPQPQLAAPGTGAAGDKDGLQEGTEQAGVEAKGLHENTREREVADVLEGAWSASANRELWKDSPVRGSPGTLGSTHKGERSHNPHEDAVLHSDAVVMPQDGEETIL